MQIEIDNNDCINKYDYKNGTESEFIYFVAQSIKQKFEVPVNFSPKLFKELKKDLQKLVITYSKKIADENPQVRKRINKE